MRFEGRDGLDHRRLVGHRRGAGEAFAAEGAALILSGRRREALEAIAGDCSVLPFEATDWAALPARSKRPGAGAAASTSSSTMPG